MEGARAAAAKLVKPTVSCVIAKSAGKRSA